jgi:hypothetical protein
MPKAKKAAESVEVETVPESTPVVEFNPANLTVEQLEALLAAKKGTNSNAVAELAAALKSAIEEVRPVKKNVITRKDITPFNPTGGPRPKLRRKTLIHGLTVDPDLHYNEEIELLNKVKPGAYCGGFIKVYKRRDKGINIDWPIKTQDQRTRLVTQFHLISLIDILQRCIEEAENPKAFKTEQDDE